MADLWYYTLNGRQMEPVSTAELKRLAADGALRPTDMVWREGMPRWVRAGSATEIFAGLPAAAKRGADGRDDPDDRPRARRRRYDEDDARPARRRPARQESGASVGVIVAVVIAGALLIAMVVAGVVIGLIASSGPTHLVSNDVAAGPTPAAPVKYDVDLVEDQNDSRLFSLKANMRYELLLQSDMNSDVDLFVFDGDREMASDIDWSKDARVVWVAPADKAYRVEVHNLGPGPNRSHVTIREFPQENVPAAEVLPPDVKGGHGVVPFDGIAPGGHEEFKLQLRANEPASVRVIAHPPNPDVRLSLTTADGQVVASAEQRGAASVQVRHTPAATAVFRVRVENAGGQPVRVTVTY